MAAILFVRVKSQLDEKELERRLIERRPRFHEVPGLVQKIYIKQHSQNSVKPSWQKRFLPLMKR
jgi:hypothetical protein